MLSLGSGGGWNNHGRASLCTTYQIQHHPINDLSFSNSRGTETHGERDPVSRLVERIVSPRRSVAAGRRGTGCLSVHSLFPKYLREFLFSEKCSALVDYSRIEYSFYERMQLIDLFPNERARVAAVEGRAFHRWVCPASLSGDPPPAVHAGDRLLPRYREVR